MSSTDHAPVSITASRRELARGIAVALAIAAVLLVFVVLPAEYGMDPTGAGKLLGLTALSEAADEKPATATPAPTAAPAAAASSATIAVRQSLPYRTDTRTVTLAPGKGKEIKAYLEKDAALVYSWKTDGGAVVSHDFHGEPANAKGDEFESFIKDTGISESRGVLIAPFTGTHGWWWGNKTDAPITVTVTASGFYADIVEK